MDMSDRIRRFIREEVMLDEQARLDDETPLLDGVLDSLALMQLVAFLEEEFDTEINDTEVTAENFRTIADIERLMSGRMART